MIVYGGELNTGKITDEVITLNILTHEWINVEISKPYKKGIFQGRCAAVFRDPNLVQTFTDITKPTYVTNT